MPVEKRDNLNEFDIEARTQNMKICVDYVFEYFNNYLNITEAEEKTVLHDEKVEKYRKQLREYEPEVREWAVGIYNEYGKQIQRHIGNIVKEDEIFFLYNTDSEFRNVSYDCYSQLIKKLPFLKDQTEMLFLFIKEYHRIEREQRFNFGVPSISEEITDWVTKNWTRHQVNLLAFAYDWINSFFDNEDIWPSTHLLEKSLKDWFVATIIDVIISAIPVLCAVSSLLRAGNIARALAKTAARMSRKALRQAFVKMGLKLAKATGLTFLATIGGALYDIIGRITGISLGSIIALGLDYLDGKKDNYIFA